MWEDAKDFREKLGSGSGTFFPCLKKNFGHDCRYCEQASQYFNSGDDEKGKRIYAKKQLWGFAYILDGPEEFKKQIVLLNYPVKVVETILDKVGNPDEDIRWNPVPTNLKEGGILVLSKKKGDRFPTYSIDYIPRPVNTVEQFKKLVGMLGKVKVDVKDVHTLIDLTVVNSNSQLIKFIPAKHMNDDSTLKLKLLPNPANPKQSPFGLVYVHYVDALSPEDKKLIQLKFDFAAYSEASDSSDWSNTSIPDDDIPF